MTTSIATTHALAEQQQAWLNAHHVDKLPVATCVIQCPNNISAEAIHNVWQQLCARHDILRTHFVHQTGLTFPRQAISDADAALAEYQGIETNIDTIDTWLAADQHLTATEQGLNLATPYRVAFCEPQAQFAIKALPLIADQLTLERLSHDIYVLLTGGTLDIVDEDGDIEELTQFVEFAEWIETLEEEDDAPEHQAFWRAQSVTPCSNHLALRLHDNLSTKPTHGTANAKNAKYTKDAKNSVRLTQRLSIASIQTWLEQQLTPAVNNEDADTSIEKCLLFVWQSVLQRHLGDDVQLGWQHDCRRDYAELAASLGPIGRTLLLRSRSEDVNGQPLSTSLAQRLLTFIHHSDEMLEAQEYATHQHMALSAPLQFRLETPLANDSGEPIAQWIAAPHLSVKDSASLSVKDSASQDEQSIGAELVLRCQYHVQTDDELASDALSLVLDFAPHAYTEASARELLSQFYHAVNALIALPLFTQENLSQLTIHDLNINAAQDDHQGAQHLIADHLAQHLITDRLMNAPHTTADAETSATQSLIQQIVAYAETQPDTPAIVVADNSGTQQHYSYRELVDAAQRCAAHFQNTLADPDLKIQAGQTPLIALSTPRNADSVACMLGAWLAGAAFIAIDNEWPLGRIAQIVNNAKPQLLMHQYDTSVRLSLAALVNHTLDMQWIEQRPFMQTPSDAYDAQASDNRPENTLAYVQYTSGSTGTPKGVKVTQHNIRNYISAVLQHIDTNNTQHWLHSATFGADMGHTLLFGALASGKTLHLAPMALLTDAEALGEYIQQHAIDVIKYVPSHVRALLNAEPKHSILPNKQLILGGEATPHGLLQRIQTQAAASGHALRILNHYGPTETTVGVAVANVVANVDANAQMTNTAFYNRFGLPLQQSLENNQLVLLNAAGKAAAIGELGTLYIVGDNVSAGYVGDVDHSERFVRLSHDLSQRVTDDEAVAGNTTVRAYNTGDLARILRFDDHHPTECVIAGRSDDQVKVRGFRVELGEISRVIDQQDAVHQAVVIMHREQDTATSSASPDDAGENRQLLCAYIVPAQAELLDAQVAQQQQAAQLSEQLREQLPDYMLPQRVILLPKLPLLGNGKVDRANLPSPESIDSNNLGECTPAETAVERVMLSIFKQVMQLDEIGVTWDFFAMGGHSLMAIKITAQIRKVLQIELPPGLLFEHSSIRKLAHAAVDFEAEPGKLHAVAQIREKLAAMTPEQLAALKKQ